MPVTQSVYVIPQTDEAEARERVQRWRKLKEAVEKLDNQEKRVRAEVWQHLLDKVCSTLDRTPIITFMPLPIHCGV